MPSPALHATFALALAVSRLLASGPNQRRVFDENWACLEALERVSEGGMTLGSVELAPLLYFTPIAIHFAVILTLTEPICEARSLSVSSFSPGLPNFLFYKSPQT
jgi:hypothetical protein